MDGWIRDMGGEGWFFVFDCWGANIFNYLEEEDEEKEE